MKDKLKDSVIIFAGSSSFRMWKSLQSDFPKVPNIINHGFGGSTMEDLNNHLDALVLNYKPKKVFIYEGDNDIAKNESIESIMKKTHNVINRILDKFPTTKIYIVSPKPSISRWSLKEKYEHLNSSFATFCESKTELFYIDVWNPMLQKGKLDSSLFISDGLHMNEKGYQIWTKEIRPFISL